MSRASRNHTVVDRRAVKRVALARIETLTADKCRDILGACRDGSLMLAGSVRELQLNVLNAFERGEISTREIERAWEGDRRAQ